MWPRHQSSVAILLSPHWLTEIALARIRPSALIVIKDFAKFVEHFCFNPNAPAGKSFACGPGRAPLSIEHASQQFRASPTAQFSSSS
jgi:hypothetical protein